MRLLLTPLLPRSVRVLAEARCPAGCTLVQRAPAAPDFAAELALAEVLVGLPRARMDAAFFARAPRLRLIQLMRAGHELIDLPAAARAGVRVATVGEATSAIVAEHTLMLMLALCRRLRWQHDAVVSGGWHVAKPWQLPSGDVDSVAEVRFDGLAGRTLGILGIGAIGLRVARLAEAFGMRVQALAHRPGETARAGVPLVPLPELLATSDVVSLHLRPGPGTANILDASALARMKPGAFLVNTARGELIDEAALHDALVRGHLAGAALDTLRTEPPPPDHPLLSLPSVLLTPHTAWLTAGSWEATLGFAFANVERLMRGAPLEAEQQAAPDNG